ncbi:Asp-tRNA(Asn)/Glu-tRNA(Gln) amidotransferase subunit GatA [SCandidatus Aminicenantes bacterium Aminicenantia_JdfR_composite]|jgi:aspartyl-tRNA(Asn)/glutamyl-tRNA(Gln) amidotransferase subunit A|nr:Asp-tRNA(Asn)/Glu-tRNA(Gln) amidotransferase subunit GatA [SCandidatus Aminicenantes bacterium Aminicenantia_JdfR_composite]MCP2597731.1 Asp-tRNA(Asn)/Glu-tRNA(Gln) amidotransferase subunit GatA [Candidatus Aminicenantes bacterium AC-335-L06]MCP2620898.1 Asp-tRNA(Asn)/Glu-tRNA(Gln) amidotransferase subunit GatA [Candidatus Aminicenantes bacterium AC-334-E05]
MKLYELSLMQLINLLNKKEVKAEEVIRSFAERIERIEKKINAFITLNLENAINSAKLIDQKKQKGKLAGIPFAIKDNILTKGIRTTCASRILENFVPPYNATVIEKIISEDGIIIGKTNMDEFAMGSSTENSGFFQTKNPWDLGRVPGGSSGGSAAAVASMEVPIALGSDTGGSIRQPAAFCGLVGLKPTYGRVSRYGLVAFASSLDQIGPLTRTVEDCAYIMNLISGFDPKDSTSSNQPVPDYLSEIKKEIKGLRIGFVGGNLIENVDSRIRELYNEILHKLEKNGIGLEEVNFTYWEYALASYYIIAPSEASSNLARYDGIKYGYRVSSYSNLKDLYSKTRTSGFGEEVKRRIILGTFALSSGYYEDYYLKAIKTRALIAKEFKEAFNRVDLIVSPTTPEPAFKFGEKLDPISMYLSDIFTITANLAGIPALSVPIGLTEENLPVGLQIMGNYFEESKILNFAYLLEKDLKFYQYKPNLT